MKLSFARSHLSITDFPEAELPDFSVLTGPNGAGKSHLLGAIANSAIQTDLEISNQADEIRLFDWNNLVPKKEGAFSSESLRAETQSIFKAYNDASEKISLLERFRQFARQHSLDTCYLSDPKALVRDRGLITLSEPQKAELDSIIQNADNRILSRIGDELQKSRLKSLSAYHNVAIASLREKEFFEAPVTDWGNVTIFQQSFGRLFVAYRDAVLKNRLAKLDHEADKVEPYHLSEVKFLERYGAPPWEFVNRTIEKAGLDFSIDKPVMNAFDPYTPKLTKRSNGQQVEFTNLSSGEKILMSFAFCVYYSSDKRQIATYPKVLLFDEIDAPLHPQMTRSLIETITETIVGEYGIKVILATHSPATVALAPEGSVFVMHPNVAGIARISKARALHVLTEGVPTVAISFEGRRQVLVESPADARNFDELYKLLRTELASERSLEFMATGLRDDAGRETNTGCAVVRQLVRALTEAGNNSVLGLIDWDGENEQEDRVHVIAHGTRNGIENVILDPLAIASLICRDCSVHQVRIGIPREMSFIEFAGSDVAFLQGIVSRICADVLGSEAIDLVEARYIGGLRLEVDKRYLHMDDHDLESKLHATYPFLKSISKGGQAGLFMRHIIQNVYRDKPEFMPVEVKDVFHAMLERQIP